MYILDESREPVRELLDWSRNGPLGVLIVPVQ